MSRKRKPPPAAPPAAPELPGPLPPPEERILWPWFIAAVVMAFALLVGALVALEKCS